MTKGKPVYFCIMRGLRGCYMPDDAAHEAARSFEQFDKSLRYEVDLYEMAWNVEAWREDDADHAEQVAALIREAWEHVQHGSHELCVAVDVRGDGEGEPWELNESYGITVGGSSLHEYREYRRDMRHAC